MGVVEPLRTVLVDDVLGDYLLISFEGRMGWVRYLLPEAKAKYRSVFPSIFFGLLYLFFR